MKTSRPSSSSAAAKRSPSERMKFAAAEASAAFWASGCRPARRGQSSRWWTRPSRRKETSFEDRERRNYEGIDEGNKDQKADKNVARWLSALCEITCSTECAGSGGPCTLSDKMEMK